MANEFFNQYMKKKNDVSDNVVEEMEGKMSKKSKLIKEREFIVNKEHLSREDYERIAEIEIEIREIKNELTKLESEVE